jgi:hypothetical protein
MFRIRNFTFFVFALAVNFCPAQKNEKTNEHRFFNDLKTSDNPGYWINVNTRKEDVKEPGNFFSATDSKNPYGLGLETGIPDDLKRKNISLFVRAQLRISDSAQHIVLVTQLSLGDSTFYWKGENVAVRCGKINEWTAFHDSLFIPSNIPPNSKLKVYIWNQDGKAEADMDNFDVVLSVFRTPTYLVY